MLLTRWRPAMTEHSPFSDDFFDFGPLAREIERFFETAGFPTLATGRAPAVDLREYDDRWVVIADLPGVDRKDVELMVEKDLLSIRAKKQYEHADKGELVRNERFFGNVERTLRLPAEVDVDRIKATLKNGVLEVVLPKREESKPRQIKVQVK